MLRSNSKKAIENIRVYVVKSTRDYLEDCERYNPLYSTDPDIIPRF